MEAAFYSGAGLVGGILVSIIYFILRRLQRLDLQRTNEKGDLHFELTRIDRVLEQLADDIKFETEQRRENDKQLLERINASRDDGR